MQLIKIVIDMLLQRQTNMPYIIKNKFNHEN